MDFSLSLQIEARSVQEWALKEIAGIFSEFYGSFSAKVLSVVIESGLTKKGPSS
jgi:hypothetical protein